MRCVPGIPAKSSLTGDLIFADMKKPAEIAGFCLTGRTFLCVRLCFLFLYIRKISHFTGVILTFKQQLIVW
ncbi:hypothetical protein RABR111495_10600 [Rahnella bruchi]